LDVSLVGGEPLIRLKELGRLLPLLAEKGITAMVVTSGIIAIPKEWMGIPGVRVAVSVDGLPEHHDVRRKPATYERILRNIEDRKVDLSWVITQVMMERRGYLEEYLEFWSARPEINRIGMNIYTPQIGEQSAEMLTPEARVQLVRQLPALKKRYPKFWMVDGVAKAFGDSALLSGRMHFFEIVGELLGGSRNPGAAVRLRWKSGLFAMRLWRYRLASSCWHTEGRRPPAREPSDELFDCNRQLYQSSSTRLDQGEPMAPRVE
jgi:MoaA/NifB/PqqE/SkfB family radical SAM enzyme